MSCRNIAWIFFYFPFFSSIGQPNRPNQEMSHRILAKQMLWNVQWPCLFPNLTADYQRARKRRKIKIVWLFLIHLKLFEIKEILLKFIFQKKIILFVAHWLDIKLIWIDPTSELILFRAKNWTNPFFTLLLIIVLFSLFEK